LQLLVDCFAHFFELFGIIFLQALQPAFNRFANLLKFLIIFITQLFQARI
jgi:hypothetical protein